MKPKPRVAALPLEAIIRIAHDVTQKAARDAVAAGRSVAGWKDGHIELFGPGARPLSSPRPDPEAPSES